MLPPSTLRDELHSVHLHGLEGRVGQPRYTVRASNQLDRTRTYISGIRVLFELIGAGLDGSGIMHLPICPSV